MILVYSPGPFGAGGALRSGKGTGPEGMLNLGGAGSAGNSGGGNVCLGGRSLTGASFGWAQGEGEFGGIAGGRKSLVNSPAEGFDGE